MINKLPARSGQPNKDTPTTRRGSTKTAKRGGRMNLNVPTPEGVQANLHPSEERHKKPPSGEGHIYISERVSGGREPPESRGGSGGGSPSVVVACLGQARCSCNSIAPPQLGALDCSIDSFWLIGFWVWCLVGPEGFRAPEVPQNRDGWPWGPPGASETPRIQNPLFCRALLSGPVLVGPRASSATLLIKSALGSLQAEVYWFASPGVSGVVAK
jgi:hypothetical protein